MATPGDGRWVWVVGPDCYLDDHGGEHPKLAPAAGALTWRCHRDTRRGDLAVLYRSRRAKDVSHLLRVTSDAARADDPEAGDPWVCRAEVVGRLPHPVRLGAMRDDPVVATWSALRSSFVRGAAPVPAEVWERLLAMAGVAVDGPDGAPSIGAGRESGTAAEEPQPVQARLSSCT